MSLIKTFLAMGIAVLLAVFVCYGLHVFYPNPQYGYVDTSTCYVQYACENLTAKCVSANASDGLTVKTVPTPYEDACYQQVYASAAYQKCMEDQQVCNNKLNQSSENYFHDRNSFYILIVLAIAAIIAGTMLWKKEGIGSGFIGGGVLIVLWSLASTYDYWSTLNKYLRLLAVGVVLVLLIWLGYKKLEKRLNKK